MKNLLKAAKKATEAVMEKQGVTVPITSDMLLLLFRRGMSTMEENEIHHVDVSLREGQLVLSGLTNKLLLPVPFEIRVKPLRAEGRVLYLEVTGMKPLNQEWIKSRVFHKPPLVTYDENLLQIDLNQLEKVRAVPVGNVKDVEISDDRLLVTIGL